MKPQSKRATSAAICGLAAVLLACGIPILGARGRPGYSHTAQFISELGESGSVNGLVVSVAGFAPTGLTVLLFLCLAAPLLPPSRHTTIGVFGFAMVGVAYLVAAVARCDAGCPAAGSLSQTLHNLFGMLEYIGAFAGLLCLGAAFRRSARWQSLAPACVVCAVLVGLGFAAMLVPSLAPVRGASQRVAETGVFFWVALVSTALLRTSEP